VRRLLARPTLERDEYLGVLKELEDATAAAREMRSIKQRTESGIKGILATITEHERTVLRLESARKELKGNLKMIREAEKKVRMLDGDLLRIWGEEKSAQRITDAISVLDRTQYQMESRKEAVLTRTRKNIEKRANRTIRSIDKDPVLGDIRIHPTTFRLGREKKVEGGKRVIPMAFLSAGEREILAISILSSFPLLTGGSLILDSPFPHMDVKRRSNLLEALPNLSDRVYLSLPEGNLSDTAIGKMEAEWKEGGMEFTHYVLEPASCGSRLRVTGGDGE
jgi:DNA sulfur modification protein DndD